MVFPVRRSQSAHSYTIVRNFVVSKFYEVIILAYQALYRKYRPQTFSDVIGQEHITETLKNELASNTCVHAYLFTGTRGTGKTSCAKILAKAVNCLDSKDGDPCLSCQSCINISDGENTDIIEIDAASNNSVESIRELRDLVNFTPSSSKYRVYIIDEVHMLSISAFNALLKTLEEPPEHVIFILATTEVHKLPATILSRCQRFDFRRIDSEKICERIQFIAENEGLSVTDNAATLIAAAADGGMRDALSILDLCASSSKEIDEAVVESVCAMAGNEYLLELADAINAHNTEEALVLIDKLHNSSVDMLRLLSGLTSHYRDLMIIKTVRGKKPPIVCSTKHLESLKEQAEAYDIKDIMYCLNILQNASAAMQSGNRRCEMEMSVIKMCDPTVSADINALERRIAALENGVVKPTVKPVKKETAKSVSETVEDEIPLPEESSSQATEISDGALESWEEILRILKTSSPLIWGVLNDSKAFIKGDYLLIDAPNAQFRTMINTANSQYKDAIRKAAFTVLGKTYKLGPYTKKSASKESDPLAEIADKLKNFEIN